LVRVSDDADDIRTIVGELARNVRFAGHRTEDACTLIEVYGGNAELQMVLQAYRSKILRNDWLRTRLAACALRLGDESSEEVLLGQLSSSRLDVAIAAAVGLLLAGSASSLRAVFDEIRARSSLAESDAFRMMGRRLDRLRVETVLFEVPARQWPRVAINRFLGGVRENPRLDVEDPLFQSLHAHTQ
jgi:hypothetical protein